MDKLDFLKNQVKQKEEDITLRGRIKSFINDIKEYAVDEESGKLSSSLLGDVVMTTMPAVGVAGTIGRKAFRQLLPSLTRKIGGTQKAWKETFNREVLDEFDKNQGFFFNNVRLFEKGLPETDVRYPLAKKAHDFYYNKVKKKDKIKESVESAFKKGEFDKDIEFSAAKMVNPKFKNRFKTDTFKTNKQGGFTLPQRKKLMKEGYTFEQIEDMQNQLYKDELDAFQQYMKLIKKK